MKIIRYPQAAQWPQLLSRPVMDLREIEARVAPILQQVRERGDDALRDFTLQFDKVHSTTCACRRRTGRGRNAGQPRN
jgi:histidinol dehydrogenase